MRSKKKKNRQKKKARINPAAPKTHHEIHSSPATATTSIRRATKHVPRVSPYSPASTNPGFVEIGLVQLLRSVTTTNVTDIHRQTDRQTNSIITPCTHPGVKRLFRLKRASVTSLPRPCLITSIEVNEASWPHTCSRPCAFEEKKISKKQKHEKNIPPHRKHTTKSTAARRPRSPQDGV